MSEVPAMSIGEHVAAPADPCRDSREHASQVPKGGDLTHPGRASTQTIAAIREGWQPMHSPSR